MNLEREDFNHVGWIELHRYCKQWQTLFAAMSSQMAEVMNLLLFLNYQHT
jgi:hypothetical protein